MRNLLAVLAIVLAFALGAGVVWHFSQREKPLPDEKALIQTVREVARLQTLDVTLYKKVAFEPDPREQKTLWGTVAQWASYSMHPPHGRAIIFAEAHLGIDLGKLDVSSLQVRGRRVEVVLPHPVVQVELKPAETEIIGSNLDSKETAELFEKARVAFEGEVAADAGLQRRARESAELTLRSLFSTLGFTEIVFVKALSPRPAHG